MHYYEKFQYFLKLSLKLDYLTDLPVELDLSTLCDFKNITNHSEVCRNEKLKKQFRSECFGHFCDVNVEIFIIN